MTTPRSRTVRRRLLGHELRRLREDAGITPKAAAEYAGVSTSTLSKIERGSQTVKTAQVRSLAQLYGVQVPEVDTLIRRAREADQHGWWAAYGETVPDWVQQYLDLEEDASALWAHESGLVFGLFQTPAYIEAVTAADRPDRPSEERARLVALRRERQQRLLGEEHELTLRVVLDEAVLHRMVGGPEVMREQLEHLSELATLDKVTLQVHPFSAGAHASAGTAFTLLRFADAVTADMDCVYLENAQGSLFQERPGDVDRYAGIFEQLTTSALSTDESLDLVARLKSQL